MDSRPLPLPCQLLELRADVDVEPTLGGVEERIDVVVVLPATSWNLKYSR